jgi:hypothetical protein
MGNGIAGYDSAFTSRDVIPLNTFVHVAVTRSVITSQIQIYLNGVLDSTFNTPHNRVIGIASPICDIYPNTIGIGFLRRFAARGNVDSVVDCFDGLIDEIAIYNRALSAEEIKASYLRVAKDVKSTLPSTATTAGLINIDFGAGRTRGYSEKTGPAVIGQTDNDFWNYYDRDISPNPNDWRRSGSLQNLKLAGGETTQISMSVSDAPGAWSLDAAQTKSSDPMYKTFLYPLDGGNNTISFTGLPSGTYDILAYSPDGNIEVSVGGISHGARVIRDEGINSAQDWEEGVQYGRWKEVSVTKGQSLMLTVRKGSSIYGHISGVQIMSPALAELTAPKPAKSDHPDAITSVPLPSWSSADHANYSVEENLRSQGFYWSRTYGKIAVGTFVEDILLGRLGQPEGRGAIGKVTSLSLGDYGQPDAMVDFGRGYSVGIHLKELAPVRLDRRPAQSGP